MVDETTRLAGLRCLDILDTSAEDDFDQLTRLAAETIGVPLAFVSLVDETRVWMKSKLGADVEQMPRESAFCATAIIGNDVLVVEDARADARFASSMAVVDFGVRFYAGAPIVLADGTAVGSFCVLDNEPRCRPEAAHLNLLRGLAIAVGRLLDLRRELRVRKEAESKLTEYARLLQLAEEMGGIGTWRIDTATSEVQLSPVARSIYGLDPQAGPAKMAELLAAYSFTDRLRVVDLLGRAGSRGIDSGVSHDLQLRRFSDGALRDVRVKAKVEPADGERTAAIFGVFRDITSEKNVMRLLNERRRASDRQATQLAQLASIDDLTGLVNRRAFVALAEALLASGEKGAFALLDLDHFKAINDQYGHGVGDEVLGDFGRICRDRASKTLTYARLGGEEFGVLASGGDAEQLMQEVECLRQAVASAAPFGSRGVTVTFSAGLAALHAGDDWKTLFKRADDALYRAKREGRDRFAHAA